MLQNLNLKKKYCLNVTKWLLKFWQLKAERGYREHNIMNLNLFNLSQLVLERT